MKVRTLADYAVMRQRLLALAQNDPVDLAALFFSSTAPAPMPVAKAALASMLAPDTWLRRQLTA